MATYDVWFGNQEEFTLVKAPARITSERIGYQESIEFESGGGNSTRSVAGVKLFEFTYPWDEGSDAVTAETFSEYAAGERGRGLLYFADPMAYDVNLFPPHWASPRLIEEGWPNIGASTPTWAATAANAYKQPARKGTWAINSASGATPLTDATIPYVIIPIHPSYTLHLGFSGAATGTGVVRVESWVNGAAAAGATVSATLLSETASTRMNMTVSGATYAYVKIYLSRTSIATSTVTLTSMMAQLALTPPTLTGVHRRGKGHTGLVFDGHPSEEFLDASPGRHYKGLSVRFRETGAWKWFTAPVLPA